jgi:hypothetical protein
LYEKHLKLWNEKEVGNIMCLYPYIIISSALLTACSPAGNEAKSETAVQVSPSEPGIVADSVYTNGRIYTVNEAQPWAEAVAIKDGEFVVVGSDADIAAVTGDGSEVVDLGGRMAMPGLVDVHNHMTGSSIAKANLSLSNPSDQDAMLADIRAFAEIGRAHV